MSKECVLTNAMLLFYSLNCSLELLKK